MSQLSEVLLLKTLQLSLVSRSSPELSIGLRTEEE